MPPLPAPSGWPEAEASEALAVYAATAELTGGLPPPDPGGAAAFFAGRFRADPPLDVLFTGYFEPVVAAALAPGAGFDHPLYAAPADPALPRAAIAAGALAGQGLEIAWLQDPLEAFLLQVQGSGRLCLPGGGRIRLGYAARNGFPYRSIGAELIRRGAIPAEAMSLTAIRAWAAAHPADVPELLLHNPSYVFFRALDLPEDQGPPGHLRRPVTAWRSLAVDPAVIPLGAPVWVELDGPMPFRRLMVAQDTGSAIRGARADIFTGTGPQAGEVAGRIRHPGRITVLRPVGG